jgi:hypothetical protein
MKKLAKSKMVIHELKPGQPLTARQKREIATLAAMPEDKIDTSEIPELPPSAWKNAVRGTRVSGVLRERMLKEVGKQLP